MLFLSSKRGKATLNPNYFILNKRNPFNIAPGKVIELLYTNYNSFYIYYRDYPFLIDM